MKGQRLSAAQDRAISNRGEFQNLALQIPNLGFQNQGEMLESIPSASAIPNPQVLPPVVDGLTTLDTAEELRRLEATVAQDIPADPVPQSAPRGEVRSKPIRSFARPAASLMEAKMRPARGGQDAPAATSTCNARWKNFDVVS